MFLFLVVLGRFASARVGLGRAALVVAGASPAFWPAADLLENSLIYALLSADPALLVGAVTLLPHDAADHVATPSPGS